MNLEPVVHPTRYTPVAVEFTDEYVMISLADGRILGMPLYFFPWLQGANETQRQDYQLYGCSVYWEENRRRYRHNRYGFGSIHCT